MQIALPYGGFCLQEGNNFEGLAFIMMYEYNTLTK